MMDAKQILEANIKLVDEKKMLLLDIDTLIDYITGKKELKESVREIIRYYRKNHIKSKVGRIRK